MRTEAKERLRGGEAARKKKNDGKEDTTDVPVSIRTVLSWAWVAG